MDTGAENNFDPDTKAWLVAKESNKLGNKVKCWLNGSGGRSALYADGEDALEQP